MGGPRSSAAEGTDGRDKRVPPVFQRGPGGTDGRDKRVPPALQRGRGDGRDKRVPPVLQRVPPVRTGFPG